MASSTSRPRVFLDISIDGDLAGRIIIELFNDHAPKTCENFIALCIGSKPPLTYKSCPFHRIIDEFMLQGGDITKGDGTGGMSIYGSEFDDENLNWRPIDGPGLLCMANRGKNTNNSQFFITLEDSSHLNGKHTVFGHVLSGQPTLDRMAKVPVDSNDKPKVSVLISHCGELERRKKAPTSSSATLQAPPLLKTSSTGHTTASQGSPSRGRRKRRHSSSLSRSRSPSPSRGHTRRSASRQRHNHRHRRQRSDLPHKNESDNEDDDENDSRKPRHHQHQQQQQNNNSHPPRKQQHQKHQSRSDLSASPPPSSSSPTPPIRDVRRRSDVSADHTLRGRPRRASPSEHARKRSPPPSRPRSSSPGYRRQRSLPNQYRRYEQAHRGYRGGGGDRRDEYGDGANDEDDDVNMQGDDGREQEGRLRRFDDEEWGGGAEDGSGQGIVYKGRGAMKFREKRRW